MAVSLDQVPADVAQIRVVITLDDARTTFGRIAAPSVFVSDGGGNRLYEYRIDGLTTESVVIAVEFYRRRGSWKVRAVGQGYAGGFAALVTDHGVTVDDSPLRAVPSRPTYPATPPQPAASSPSYPPPLASTVDHSPPASAAPSDAAGAVRLSKDRPVSLAKGQRVTLRKDGGVALTFIRMGLGWDPIRRGGLFGRRAIDIDLDAWVAMFADRNLVDIVYYGQLASKDGSIRHQGDNLTGAGEGDDEVILVDLTRVPAHVTTLLFVVTSYQGHTFEKVVNAFCRLVDNTTDTELARYSLTGGMRFTAMAMAKVFRGAGDWQLQALGEGFHAKHPGEAVPLLGRFVTRG